jgi:hypothetical protein
MTASRAMTEPGTKGECVGPLLKLKVMIAVSRSPLSAMGSSTALSGSAVPTAGPPTRQTVCDRRDKKYGHCRPPAAIRRLLFHPFSIINGEQHEDR